MNIILYFAILCGAIHVHSMRKEAPSLNDFLFFNGLMQKPRHLETKNEINDLPEVPLRANNEIDVSELFSPFSQKEKRVNVVPESPKITDEEFDVPELFRDLISVPEQQLVNEDTKAPSQTEEKEYVSEMFNDQFPTKEQKNKNVPTSISKTNGENDFFKLLNDLFPQAEQKVNVAPKSPKITNKEFDVSELFRDLNSAPEEQLVNEETKAPSQNEEPQKEQKEKNLPKAISKCDEEIEFSKLLNDLFPQTEQIVNVVPESPTKSNSEVYVSEAFRDLISGPEERLEISGLVHDFFSPQNEEVVKMVPIESPKIEKGLQIPDLFIEIIPIQKEPKQPIEVKIDEEINFIVPPNNLTTDEKKEISPKPNLTTKITELLSDIVSPLEQRLLDEFERALVPLNDIIELGANIKNSPFTEEEKEKLGLFTIYMETTQELYSEFKSQVHSFGANRFYETAVHKNYRLSEKQKNHAINVLKDTIERVKSESNAIYDLILKPENQQLIKSIENKQLELSASLRAISLALKANYAHLIDDDKMQDVKTKRLLIIEENSKLMIELIQSKALRSLKDGIIEHVDKLIDIMNKLPMKITLSYMF